MRNRLSVVVIMLNLILATGCGSDKSTKSGPDEIAPAAIADLIIAAFSDSSFTINWTAPGDNGSSGQAATYDIRYSTQAITDNNWDQATQVTHEPAPKTAGSLESIEITVLSLVAETQSDIPYFFAIRTADEVENWSPLSNVASGTLREFVAPDPITDLTISSVSDTSVTLSWTATGDDGDAGTAAAYDIRYDSQPLTEQTWDAAIQASGEPVPQVAGSSESMEVIVDPVVAASLIAGLDSDETWYFGIRAIDESDNESDISNVAGSLLEDDTPPNMITDLSVIEVTDTSVVLEWTAPGDDGTSGTASEYDIRYSTSAINVGSWNSATQVDGEPTPQPSGTMEMMEVVLSHSGTLRAQITDDAFSIAIRAIDDRGNVSNISNVVSQILPDIIAPDAIDDLFVEEVGETSVSLSWSAPGDDNNEGTAATYEVRYSTELITDGNWDAASIGSNPPTPQSPGSTENYELTGLTTGTAYYVAVRTRDEADNWSAVSNVVMATPIEIVVVGFPDSELEQAVRDQLSKPTGDFTSLDMLQLTQLNHQNGSIADLTGLEYALNLSYLNIVNNNVTDLSPLSGLTQLTFLNIEGNGLSDLSPLSGLAAMTELRISQNSISDISALSQMSNLHSFIAWENQISDLTPMSGWTSLSYTQLSANNVSDVSPLSGLSLLFYLILNSNAISDLAPLAGMSQLLELNLADNQITDISALSGLTNLTFLRLSDNNITSINAVSGMTKLEEFSAVDNSIVDLSPLSGLTAIVKLWLYNNSITDLSPLSNLTNIEEMSLYYNSISDLSPIANMTKMRRLFLDNNNIGSLSPLSGMTDMTELTCGSNNISDLSPVGGMTNLVELAAWSNNISDISVVSGMTKLNILNMGSNSFSDLTPIAGLTSLRYLSVSETPVVDISPLQVLDNIYQINLSYTQVVDLLPLVNNSGLGSGDAISLYSVPTLSDASLNTYIPALEARGVNVNR